MALVDDLIAPTPTEEIDRRKALGKMSAGALAIAGVGTLITSVRYLRPNVLFEPATRFKLGRPEDIPVGTLLVISDRRLYVVRTDDGFIALSAVCTHLGCMTRYDVAEKTITCPCHGSGFSNTGIVLAGPAPAPLVRLGLEVQGGQLVVDTSKTMDDDFVLEA